MAASKVEHEVKNSKDIELLAIFRGMHICARIGIHKIIVESDNLLMVNQLRQVLQTPC